MKIADQPIEENLAMLDAFRARALALRGYRSAGETRPTS
jgi:hypothetical protein